MRLVRRSSKSEGGSRDLPLQRTTGHDLYGDARPIVSGDDGLRRRLQPVLRTCDGDEYSGFISAFGAVADMGGFAAGSTRSQMTQPKHGRLRLLAAQN